MRIQAGRYWAGCTGPWWLSQDFDFPYEPWRNLGRGGTGSDSGLHGLPLAAVGTTLRRVKVESREAREEEPALLSVSFGAPDKTKQGTFRVMGAGERAYAGPSEPRKGSSALVLSCVAWGRR